MPGQTTKDPEVLFFQHSSVFFSDQVDEPWTEKNRDIVDAVCLTQTSEPTKKLQ